MFHAPLSTLKKQSTKILKYIKHLKIIEVVIKKGSKGGRKTGSGQCVNYGTFIQGCFGRVQIFNGTEISLSFIPNAVCVLLPGSTYVATAVLHASFFLFSFPLSSFFLFSLSGSMTH